jgi:excinuclease ABC subunit A
LYLPFNYLKSKYMPSKNIIIKGARVHNLQNVDLELPKNKFTVISGLSGSGKSSLAFDTLYAESQRRYMESLSAYSKQFLDLMDKPDVDSIEGLPPAISIGQGSNNRSPRSTVGTVTEIYDYLRLLFARIGKVHCPKCGCLVEKQDLKKIITNVQKKYLDKDIIILAPITRSQKTSNSSILKKIKKSSYDLVRVDKEFYSIDEALNLNFDGNKNHQIDVVVDKLKPSLEKKTKNVLAEAIATAIDLSNGYLIVYDNVSGEESIFSKQLYCTSCDLSFPDIEPRNFSFNSPHGACQKCGGLGIKLKLDAELVIPNPRLTLNEGAIRLLFKISVNQNNYYKILEKAVKDHKININIPVQDLKKEHLDIILYGSKEKDSFVGIIPYLEAKHQETDSDYVRSEIEKCMRTYECPSCRGKRLRKESLAVKVLDQNISDISSLTIEEAKKFFGNIVKQKADFILNKKDLQIAERIVKEIVFRLKSVHDVGLNYLSLDRSAVSLSGGEMQRIRLATQINSSLSGVLYILDEPSIGLHQKDNFRLIKTLKNLQDLGNTIIVIEHDRDTILAADYLVDVGPGAGENGGQIISVGTPEQVKRDKNSITGKYLSNKLKIEVPKKYHQGNGKYLEIIGANEFNLKDIDVKIPLGELVCVTGVSGSGKSTLIFEILGKALSNKLTRAKDLPGEHKEIKGLKNIDKVINIDQSPIGRTPRSNPATYTGVFTYIRDLFANLPESKIRGYKLGKFSFNVRGGRCEECQGNGLVKIGMNFLPDMYVECEECHGKRYNSDILEIHYKDKDIAEVLDMTVSEAMLFFKNVPNIYNKLRTLNNVGLGYLKLGQSATTLSGGEAQRVKLATELSRKATGKTLYILDEPTTGLHFDDINKLIDVLQKLVDKGNSVLIIEHNLDVIKCADWIIDLGPGGGDKGGEIVAQGTPKEIIKIKKSYTGEYLSELI